MDAFPSLILAGGLQIGDFTLPWSWIIFLVVIAIGLMLIRTAMTLVKIAIIVGIGVVIFLGVQYLFKNFT
jgi:hypothetical protein